MFFSSRFFRGAAAAFATCALSACSFGSHASSSAAVPLVSSEHRTDAGSNGAAKIKHVVIVVQENRSFNSLFQGYPGAETVASGQTKSGKMLTLKAVGLATRYDIDHSASAMFAACDGSGVPGTNCKMDAFDQEQQLGGPRNGQYVYVPHAESKPYFDMAHEWVLADHMFASQLDESFVSHQYIIAAQAQSSVDLPFLPQWGCEGGKRNFVETVLKDRSFGNPQRACFDYATLGDELDHANRSWRFYTSKVVDPADGVWSGYQAVRHIRYGPDWKKDVITPQKRFLRDIAAGSLADVTWITPTCEDSDHVNCGGGFGPSWVTAVVNAIGTSSFWDTTAIFVMWDDWGGLYDPVPPPYLDDDGLGFRVPLLVISPYAKKSYVSHVRYEHGSILKFAEDLFGLGRLAASDTRANSPAADCFDFSQPPRAFVPIHAPKGPAFFLHRADDLRPPDNQ